MKRQQKAGNPLEGNVISSIFSRSVNALILNGIATFLGSIIDGLVISRELGTVSMSAYQLVSPFTSFIGMVALFFSVGVQNKYSEYLGSGQKEKAHAALSLITALSVLSGLLITLAMVCFTGPMAQLLGAAKDSGQLYVETMAYLRGLAPGVTAMLLIPLIAFLLNIEGRRGTLLLGIAVMSVVNLFGDLSSVYLFHSGMLGMGLASSACFISLLLVALASFVRKKPDFRFRFGTIGLPALGPLFLVGLPSAVERFLLTLQVSLLNRILIGISVEAVAIYSILGILNMVIQSIADGISSTTFTMSSVFVGDEDGESLRSLFRIFLKKTLWVGLCVTIAVFALASPLIGVFMGAESIRIHTAGVAALRILILYFPAYTFLRSYHKSTTALGNMRLSFAIPILEDAVFFIPISWMLARGSGQMIWASFAVAEMLTLAVILILAFAKSRSGEHSSFLDALQKIPASLAQRRQEDYTMSLGADMQAVIRCSQDVASFLKEGQAGDRAAFLTALAVEEMCGNIVKFNPGKANLSMDVRMIVREDHCLVRIRDNGKAFNPEQWSQIHESDDPAANIGIRMVAHFAEKFTYTNILGMNNLAIRIARARKQS